MYGKSKKEVTKLWIGYREWKIEMVSCEEDASEWEIEKTFVWKASKDTRASSGQLVGQW